MKSVSIYKQATVTCGFLAALTAYLAVVLGTQVRPSYFTGLGFSAVLAIATYLLYRKYQVASKLASLRAAWGKRVKRKRPMSEIRGYFDCRRAFGFSIDDRTWEDLTMDRVFAEIDRTHSTPGEQVLYDLLRRPLSDREGLKERGRVIRLLEENSALREKLGMALLGLGRDREGGTTWLLYNRLKARPQRLLLYRGLFALALLSPAAFLLSVKTGVAAVFAIFSINMLVQYKEERRIQGHFSSVKYLARLLQCARKIAGALGRELPEYQKGINENLAAVQSLERYAGLVGRMPTGGDPLEALTVYVRIFLLLEVRGFWQAMEIIDGHRPRLQELYRQVGLIDALLAVASFRAGSDQYCEPEFLPRRRKLDIKGLYHPLLSRPVPNSIGVKKGGMLVSGSNMSGKSTFLRAVGLNVLLAQTIYTCPAARYRGGFFQLITSIGRTDNIIEGKSYYLVEAEALLRIIRSIEDAGIPVLCILDEIFRGTNSLERIAAAHRVLQYLAGENCLVLAATHDLELTDLLADVFDNYHFQEKVGEQGLEFDYRLKPGPATTRNAIALLKYLGYPAEIVEKARKDVQTQLAT